MAKNETYKKLIHTERWLKLRKLTLEAHPYCQRCEANGVLTFATEVHHVVPCEYALTTQAMESLMFDPNNVQALCHNCHVEAHKEMGRSGRAAAKRANEAKLESNIKKFY